MSPTTVDSLPSGKNLDYYVRLYEPGAPARNYVVLAGEILVLQSELGAA